MKVKMSLIKLPRKAEEVVFSLDPKIEKNYISSIEDEFLRTFTVNLIKRYKVGSVKKVENGWMVVEDESFYNDCEVFFERISKVSQIIDNIKNNFALQLWDFGGQERFLLGTLNRILFESNKNPNDEHYLKSCEALLRGAIFNIGVFYDHNTLVKLHEFSDVIKCLEYGKEKYPEIIWDVKGWRNEENFRDLPEVKTLLVHTKIDTFIDPLDEDTVSSLNEYLESEVGERVREWYNNDKNILGYVPVSSRKITNFLNVEAVVNIIGIIATLQKYKEKVIKCAITGDGFAGKTQLLSAFEYLNGKRRYYYVTPEEITVDMDFFSINFDKENFFWDNKDLKWTLVGDIAGHLFSSSLGIANMENNIKIFPVRPEFLYSTARNNYEKVKEVVNEVKNDFGKRWWYSKIGADLQRKGISEAEISKEWENYKNSISLQDRILEVLCEEFEIGELKTIKGYWKIKGKEDKWEVEKIERIADAIGIKKEHLESII